MLTSSIRTAVEDRIPDETLDLLRLDRFIASAVREYNRYNPIVLSTVLSTVIDQNEYDLSSYDVLLVLRCWWYPIGQVSAELRAGAENLFLMKRSSRYHMPSERVIDDINQSAYLQRVTGYWDQRGSTLVIYPTPSSSGYEDLEIEYTSPHVINATGTGYDTIPDEDLSILANLTIAHYLESRMMGLSVAPDYAEGLQRVTYHYVAGNVTATIAELKRGLLGKYDGAGKALAR